MDQPISITKILTKLNLIMADVDYIQKDKKNEYFNYRYASEAAIKNKLHELLVKHKVLIFPTSAKITAYREYISDKGKRSALTDVQFVYRFYDTESGEYVEGEFCGTGDDTADKGTYKAITGAIKYILTTTFLIPTGDDPEETPKDTEKAQPAKPVAKPPVKPPQQATASASDPADAQKAEIMHLITDLEPELIGPTVNQAQKGILCKQFVFQTTQLVLKTENYAAIIQKLKELQDKRDVELFNKLGTPEEKPLPPGVH